MQKVENYSSQVVVTKAPAPTTLCGERVKITKKALFILTTFTVMISLVPGVGLVPAFILKGFSCLSKILYFSQIEKRSDRVLLIFKISIVVFGIVSLALAMPALLIPALSADIAYQIFIVVKTACSKENKLWLKADRVYALIVKVLVLVSVITGCWQIMIGALAISLVAMLIFAIQHRARNQQMSRLDILCHIALGSAFLVSKKAPKTITPPVLVNALFLVTKKVRGLARLSR